MICKTIKLWEDNNATLKTYILGGDKVRGAVLICPGGGYNYVSDREAEPIALQFNQKGYHSFVLNYRVLPFKHPLPLLDLAKAMCVIRNHAKVWQLDSNKVALCGFSAGGHLASSLAAFYNNQELINHPNIDNDLLKPNALILAYPVITSGPYAHRGSFQCLLDDESNQELLNKMSIEKQVSKKMPPTFIWHTLNDLVVPVENTLLLVEALRKYEVPFELHIYPDGPHGLSLANKETATNKSQINPHVATWLNLSTEWLEYIFRGEEK